MPLQLLHPRRWSPPPAPARAWAATGLAPLRNFRLLPLPGPGPEDVVVDPDGMLVTGLADGRVLRVDPGSGQWEQLADTGGRPLGLEPGPDGTVFACDHDRGLLRIDPGGAVVPLVEAVDGHRLNFASNVVRSPDGTLYFSASTRRFDLAHYEGDLLEHSGTGRLFRLRPGATEPETLLDGLHFANGVVLSPDGSHLLVAETAAYRITRYRLTGAAAGSSDRLVENLPGFPDNMALGGDGLVWVSIPAPRDPTLDRLLPLPGPLRQAAWVLPDRLRPKPAATVWALAFDLDGRLVHDFQGRATELGYSMVTSAVEHRGTVYLGSLHESALAAFEI
ncbi:SMP-30/gluconolactonase/LRE family protein [Jatrophihabitans fulvus]